MADIASPSALRNAASDLGALAERLHAAIIPLRPVVQRVDAGTVEALEALLEGAKEGSVTGIAFAVSLSRDSCEPFLSNVAGHCRENPTLTRGMVAYLMDQVATLQHRNIE
jgi:hypothetical protein